MSRQSLIIGWLYPDLMSTYGDRGNIFCLQRRLEWRGMEAQILPITVDTTANEVSSCDLIVGGGAQDRAQELAITDLRDHKKKSLQTLFRRGVPGLFVCGAPQLLGHYYTTAEGKKLEGLGLIDYYTVHPGLDQPRCIGNTVGEIPPDFSVPGVSFRRTIVGFENHGGRTYLGSNTRPFAKVLIGNGNNGTDGTEGAVQDHVIACYYHGPLLAKNPHIADWLLTKALSVKYGKEIPLSSLDDQLEWHAHDVMLSRLLR